MKLCRDVEVRRVVDKGQGGLEFAVLEGAVAVVGVGPVGGVQPSEGAGGCGAPHLEDHDLVAGLLFGLLVTAFGGISRLVALRRGATGLGVVGPLGVVRAGATARDSTDESDQNEETGEPETAQADDLPRAGLLRWRRRERRLSEGLLGAARSGLLRRVLLLAHGPPWGICR